MGLTAEDRLELLELVNNYARYFDDGDGKGWADLFAPEGRFVLAGVDEFKGEEALSELVRVRNSEAPGIRHLTTNVSVRDADSGATGTAYALVLRVRPGEPIRLRTAGLYEDEFVRVDGRWRFHLRVFTAWLDPEDLDRPFSFGESSQSS